MAEEVSSRNTESAGLFLIDQAMGFGYAAALRAAAVIGVADHFTDGPNEVEQLAVKTGTDAQKLYRVLRLLATRGVFREADQGKFELTDTAEPLRTDAPLSVRAGITMLTSKAIWVSSGELAMSLRGEGISFEMIFGKGVWEHWGHELPAEEEFHTGMASMSGPEIPSPVRSYQFPEGATVVDVGGGQGALLHLVLSQNPSLRGILYDKDNALAGHRLAELGDDARWDTESGNVFESCPSGDVYLLKYIIHDWDDERAGLVLRNCREAMAPGGRVLIFEVVIPRDNTPHTGKLMDMILMSIYPGRERTEQEFRQLLASAGLRLTRITKTDHYLSLIEAVAA